MTDGAATACPFCLTEGTDRRCSACRRDRTAPRRICKACKQATPIAEARCCHCGKASTSDLAWKVPVIVALFALAFAAAILLQVYGE